jgi:DNA-binding MarR family transcriptional regulator
LTEAERLARALERLVAAVIRRRGAIAGPEPQQLTTTQGLALLAVVDAGSLRLGALADLLGTTDATASRTADALERLELVRRIPDPQDRRGIYVAPTPTGRLEARRRRRRGAAMVGELLKGLAPDEQRRFVNLVDDLNGLLVVADGRAVGSPASAVPVRAAPRQAPRHLRARRRRSGSDSRR